MARPRFLRRDADLPEQPKPAAVRRPAAGVLRRERRTLQRLREQRLRDLGGLLLEMYRRGSFREELLSEQCADLVAIETRLAEVELTLTTPRRRRPAASAARRSCRARASARAAVAPSAVPRPRRPSCRGRRR